MKICSRGRNPPASVSDKNLSRSNSVTGCDRASSSTSWLRRQNILNVDQRGTSSLFQSCSQKKALEKKHVWTECYSTQMEGGDIHANMATLSLPLPLSLNKQPANTWMAAQIWQLMYPPLPWRRRGSLRVLGGWWRPNMATQTGDVASFFFSTLRV